MTTAACRRPGLSLSGDCASIVRNETNDFTLTYVFDAAHTFALVETGAFVVD